MEKAPATTFTETSISFSNQHTHQRRAHKSRRGMAALGAIMAAADDSYPYALIGYSPDGLRRGLYILAMPDGTCRKAVVRR